MSDWEELVRVLREALGTDSDQMQFVRVNAAGTLGAVFQSSWETNAVPKIADAILSAGYAKSTRLAEVEAEAAVLLEALKAAQEMADMLSTAVSKASCETQDCESAPWETLVHGYWYDGMMASYIQQIEEAVSGAPLAAAHLAEVERLKANQRRRGMIEVCRVCKKTNPPPTGCDGIEVDTMYVNACPHRPTPPRTGGGG